VNQSETRKFAGLVIKERKCELAWNPKDRWTCYQRKEMRISLNPEGSLDLLLKKRKCELAWNPKVRWACYLK